MTALTPGIRTEAAAVCSIGNHDFCMWATSGTEAEISAAADEHAAANPGHRIVCQAKHTRTWAVQSKPGTTKGEGR